MKKKLGFILNPVAGMGGRVGLKGTDGAHTLKMAKELGATPLAAARAVAALQQLLPLREELAVFSCPASMGEDVLQQVGFLPQVVGERKVLETSGSDTERGAAEMLDRGVDLLLFAGGDGTARNIYNAVGDQLTVLGIPAGVKIHSAVFASSPVNAGVLSELYLRGSGMPTAEAEVMDIDEEAFRQGRVSARLYGYMAVPCDKRFLQNLKAGGEAGDEEVLAAIAYRVAEEMEDNCLYLIGPGTTTRAVMAELKLPNTLLGVDVVWNKELLAADVGESELLNLMEGKRAKIIVTIIGGQGYIFGRGNQQFSPEVINRAGRENIIVIASRAKILSLGGQPLRVDTGDEQTDRLLSGYMKVITGAQESSICRVSY